MRKFIRTRPASPPPPHASLPPPAAAAPPLYDAPPHKTNGHANGAAGGARGGAESGTADELSSLSRAWSESEEAGAGGGCVAPAPLWEDPEFPASWRALGGKRRACGVHWKRPTELCARPVFRGERGDSDSDADRWRVVRGSVCEAHVCVAGAALALTPRLLERAVPRQPRAARALGRYTFRLWEFGAWREVSVDDRLPTRGGRLLCSRSAAPHDFTLPLLEKAYAKLRGGYAALRRGGGGEGVADALRALTGGLVQSFELSCTPPARVLRALEAAAPRATLALAWGGERAVAVSGLARVRTAAGAPLLRVRSAGGAGPGEGGGAAWRALAPTDRDLLAARADPGDCWLSFSEFLRAFSRLELVHVPPDDWVLEPALQARRPWRAVLARRRWRPGHNAGGAPPARTASANPQFHLQVRAQPESHVVVSVAQRAPPAHRVGFALFACGERAPRRAAALQLLRPLDAAHAARAQEVVAFFTLPPGRYLVVPHAARPHVDAAFLLRILTDERADVWEVNEDNALVCGGALDLEEGAALPRGVAAAAARAAARWARDGALEAAALRAALRRVWRACLEARPSPALCRALAPLGDAALRGALPAAALPALVARLAAWRGAWRDAGGGARREAYSLRALLAASGARVSNKVLEGLVVRFARGGGRWLRHEDYVLALARLHLAHARHSALDARHKTSPLSLEEMILMTIYT